MLTYAVLQEWYAAGLWKRGRTPELDVCDALRLALLYTLGGTYADVC